MDIDHTTKIELVKNGIVFFNFEIEQAPSEIAATLPGQFSHYGRADIFALVRSNSEFYNKKF